MAPRTGPDADFIISADASKFGIAAVYYKKISRATYALVPISLLYFNPLT
jgi:hypothetical protein